jgi:SPP1 gp7 family putative phage head morphogenesis protein
MSTQDNINGAVTRHQIFVLRYAKGREKDAADFISEQMLDIIRRLESGSMTDYGSQRAEAQLKDMYLYLRETDSVYAKIFSDEIEKFGNYEAEFNAKLISKEIGVDLSVPAPVQLQQAIFGDIMSVEPTKGYTIGSMLGEFGPAHANMVTSRIRSGFMLGETTDQIARRIKELIPVQQRKASTIARTVTNHASVQARKQTLKENDDVLLGYEWVSTLDSRTSLICMSRDGVIYKDYDKDPKPPAHFNCRSTIVPKVDPRFDLGADIKSTRPAKGSKGVKQVDSETNYSSWLRTQPKSFQDEVLGKSRADLFRGGVTLDKFVDNNGRPLTLDQLRGLDEGFNGVSAEVPQIVAPPPPEPLSPTKTDAVLPDIFTTGKNVTKEKLNAVYDEIGTPEMAKLQQFMQEKRIKTLILNKSQMSMGKTSRKISQPVMDYLIDDPKPEQAYLDEMIGGRAGGYAFRLYTSRNAKNSNGYTSFAYRHVVLKNQTDAKFKDPKQSAKNIKMLVKEFVDDRTGRKPWSFSSGVGRIYGDSSGAMATTQIHELGHQVHYYAGAPDFPEYLKDKLVTEYGGYNNAESHAEHFVAWVVDRASLEKRSPEMARYFDDMVDKAIRSSYRSRPNR